MRLKNLASLTHEKISLAHFDILKFGDRDLAPPFQAIICPYQRARKLILSLEKSKKPEFYVYFLCELLGGKQSEALTLLLDKTDLLKASLIFLNFRAQGKNYVPISGESNTCLHDALDCGNLRKELVDLLIRHGADPDQENEQGLSALGAHFESLDKKDTILHTKIWSPQKKIILYLAGQVIEENPKALALFKLAREYHFFQRNPELANFNCRDLLEGNSHLLHLAVDHSAALVKFMLMDLKADPHLLNDDKMRPVDYAAMLLSSAKLTHRKRYLLSISRLLFHALPETENTSIALVNELLKLVIHDQDRAEICLNLFRLYPEDFPRSLRIRILNDLKRRLSGIKHPEITLENRIGSGTYGEVFFARQYARPVAVKLGKLPDFDRNYDIFLEAGVHAGFQHPNIIQFISTIERNNRFGIVMEYANCSLASCIWKAWYDPENCFYSYARQMNAGLRYIHQQGFVHLDFKPANILLQKPWTGRDALLKIADFGATAPAGELQLSRVTTTDYCSPECFYPGKPYQAANDTFSYGVVLGEMYTKQAPWSELDSEIHLLAKTGDEEPVFLNVVRDKVCSSQRTSFGNTTFPPGIARLIVSCWQQKPSSRPDEAEIEEYLDTHLKFEV